MIKLLTKKLLASFGWKVHRPSRGLTILYKADKELGIDEEDDILRFFDRNDSIVIADVGANVGQSVHKYRSLFPNSIIHSFEPSPKTFQLLKKNTAGLAGVHIYNMALGAEEGRVKFFEHEVHVNSSILPVGKDQHASNVTEIEVQCSTLDLVCSRNNVPHINILKVDTQGFDLQVLNGAKDLIKARKVDMVLIEHIVAELYKNSPGYGEQVRFFEDNGFRLVTNYRINYQGNFATWFDALYVRDSFGQK